MMDDDWLDRLRVVWDGERTIAILAGAGLRDRARVGERLDPTDVAVHGLPDDDTESILLSRFVIPPDLNWIELLSIPLAMRRLAIDVREDHDWRRALVITLAADAVPTAAAGHVLYGTGPIDEEGHIRLAEEPVRPGAAPRVRVDIAAQMAERHGRHLLWSVFVRQSGARADHGAPKLAVAPAMLVFPAAADQAVTIAALPYQQLKQDGPSGAVGFGIHTATRRRLIPPTLGLRLPPGGLGRAALDRLVAGISLSQRRAAAIADAIANDPLRVDPLEPREIQAYITGRSGREPPALVLDAVSDRRGTDIYACSVSRALRQGPDLRPVTGSEDPANQRPGASEINIELSFPGAGVGDVIFVVDQRHNPQLRLETIPIRLTSDDDAKQASPAVIAFEVRLEGLAPIALREDDERLRAAASVAIETDVSPPPSDEGAPARALWDQELQERLQAIHPQNNARTIMRRLQPLGPLVVEAYLSALDANPAGARDAKAPSIADFARDAPVAKAVFDARLTARDHRVAAAYPATMSHLAYRAAAACGAADLVPADLAPHDQIAAYDILIGAGLLWRFRAAGISWSPGALDTVDGARALVDVLGDEERVRSALTTLEDSDSTTEVEIIARHLQRRQQGAVGPLAEALKVERVIREEEERIKRNEEIVGEIEGIGPDEPEIEPGEHRPPAPARTLDEIRSTIRALLTRARTMYGGRSSPFPVDLGRLIAKIEKTNLEALDRHSLTRILAKVQTRVAAPQLATAVEDAVGWLEAWADAKGFVERMTPANDPDSSGPSATKRQVIHNMRIAVHPFLPGRTRSGQIPLEPSRRDLARRIEEFCSRRRQDGVDVPKDVLEDLTTLGVLLLFHKVHRAIETALDQIAGDESRPDLADRARILRGRQFLVWPLDAETTLRETRSLAGEAGLSRELDAALELPAVDSPRRSMRAV